MDREAGRFDQTNDRLESILARHRKRGVDTQTQLRQPNNIGQVEVFKGVVVRNVQKDGLDPPLASHVTSGKLSGRKTGETICDVWF